MAMIYCAECGNRISNTTDKCKFCGAPMAEASKVKAPPPKPTKYEEWIKANSRYYLEKCFYAIPALFIIILILLFLLYGKLLDKIELGNITQLEKYDIELDTFKYKNSKNPSISEIENKLSKFQDYTALIQDLQKTDLTPVQKDLRKNFTFKVIQKQDQMLPKLRQDYPRALLSHLRNNDFELVSYKTSSFVTGADNKIIKLIDLNEAEPEKLKIFYGQIFSQLKELRYSEIILKTPSYSTNFTIRDRSDKELILWE
jgi:hypothetical protein